MTALAVDEARACSKCGEAKPLAEFYERRKGSGDRLPHCRDCDNTRPRSRNAAKVIRIRARHRATAELIKRHDDEFRDLLEYFTAAATDEAWIIAEGRQRHAHEGAGNETPRLRPGAAREGQTVKERVDVARCPHCIKNHDRGHACPKCGAKPLTEEDLTVAIRSLLERGLGVPQIVVALRTTPQRVGLVIDQEGGT